MGKCNPRCSKGMRFSLDVCRNRNRDRWTFVCLIAIFLSLVRRISGPWWQFGNSNGKHCEISAHLALETQSKAGSAELDPAMGEETDRFGCICSKLSHSNAITSKKQVALHHIEQQLEEFFLLLFKRLSMLPHSTCRCNLC